MSKSNSDWEVAKNMEIWEDKLSMDILNRQTFLIGCNDEERIRVNKQMLHYY